MVQADALIEASGLAGRGSVRPATVEDEIDGVRPGFVVEPDDAGAVAAVLGASSRQQLVVVLRGGGTKISWGRRPDRVDLLVSTRRLARIVEHAQGDLTITVEAGATIAGINQELAPHGHWLPLDAASEASTVGGTIATNDSGPLRHRYGAPRDLLIGIGLATADGRLVKSGGKVVKNVAGYDLGKCISGSFGGLAAIVTATFKLVPLPSASSTLRLEFTDRAAAAGAAAALGSSQLDPVALDIHADGSSSRVELLVRFASTGAAVEAQTAAAGRLAEPFAPERVVRISGVAEADLWREHVQRVWRGPATVVKASWLPAALCDVMALVADLRDSGARSVEIIGRAAAGTGLLRIDADSPAQVAALRRLRERSDLVGNVVLLRAAPDVKASVDVWGLPGDTANLLRALKGAFDPVGILNAGRGPL